MPKHLQVVGVGTELEPMTIDFLKQCIERYRDEKVPIFLQRPMLMLPETATYALRNHNWNNRSMRDRKVMAYAGMMGQRDWSMNNTTVGFATTGRLMDGQQRCKACEAAKTPFPTGFCFGMQDDSFDTMDVGASRNHEDMVKSLGAKYPREAAVAIRWVEWLLTGAALIRKPAYAPQELTPLWERHKDVEHWVLTARQIIAHTDVWISAGVVAAFLHIFTEIDAKLAGRFATAWKDGNYGEAFQGLRQAQSRLGVLREKHNVKGGDAYQSARAGLIILAWNAARHFQRTGAQGKPVTWSAEKFHVCPPIDGGPAPKAR